MNIIFGKAQADTLKDKFIILELDTLKVGDGEPIVTYCVVENIPTENLSAVKTLWTLHQSMIDQYRNRKWSECLSSIHTLYGKWGSDMNTFYDHIRNRVEQYVESDPGDSWEPVLHK